MDSTRVAFGLLVALLILAGVGSLFEFLAHRSALALTRSQKAVNENLPRKLQFHLSTAILAMLLAGVLMGTVRWGWRRARGMTAELERIQTADPIADAKDAFERKDYCFRTVLADGRDFPGVSKDLKGCYGYRDIDGTGCCCLWEDEAWEYANAYNRCMSQELLAQERTQSQ